MIITLSGNLNHTYNQALRVAYDKGMAEGTLDEQTIKECEAEFLREKYVVPDDVVTLGGARPDGWQCYCRSGLQQGYEEAMERARKRHGLPSLEVAQGAQGAQSDQVGKEIVDSDELDLAGQSSTTSDNHENLKSLFASVTLSVRHQQMLARMFIECVGPNVNSDRENKKRSVDEVGLDIAKIDQRQIVPPS